MSALEIFVASADLQTRGVHPQSEPPPVWSLEAVADWHASGRRDLAASALAQPVHTPDALLAWIRAGLDHLPTLSVCREACKLVLALVAESERHPEALNVAVRLGGRLRSAYINPDGSIAEYDRASWLKDPELWKTTPWGTAFKGTELLRCYRALNPHLGPCDRAAWQIDLRRVAAWIRGNPVAATVVYNCAVELQRLLWELGGEFGEDAWRKDALRTAIERTRSDMSHDGWITGEGKGCSGFYQMVGLEFLGLFALASQDETLMELFHRGFRATVAWCAPDMTYAGNFGTRSTWFKKLKPGLVLVASSLGHRRAARWVRQFGAPDWSDDINLWQEALATAPDPAPGPAPEPAVAFDTIKGLRFSRDGWTAWWTANPLSIWSRGWIGLHHEEAGPVFSPLHSLETEIEKSKLLIGDTTDWAGFPKVGIATENDSFTSHRDAGTRWEVEPALPGVRWTEALLSIDGRRGGELHGDLMWNGGGIHLGFDLRHVAPGSAVHLDFHFMKRPEQHFGIWVGEHAEAVRQGKMPRTSGHFTDEEFQVDSPGLCGMQIGRSVFFLAWEVMPGCERISACLAGDRGLHTGDLGGGRLRFEFPLWPDRPECKFSFHLEARA